MYLKKIEISGFKSFANKTKLDFLINSEKEKKYGVTAIVGPNGSGKSNIADALRWVLGEQSMKRLRSKKSQDIIFAGSGKKARLGSAYVTLYLDNSDKKLPLDFQEVSISRKLFRSGESEFLINGSRVRLQDVIDILAKANIGKGSFTIVNQGMADSVLKATPLERRIIIEDAAGVKQYQIKKERSFRKLELTRQNLERVHELIQEIKPHLRLLKRQAAKAVQSESVVRELKEKQNKLYSFLWHNFQEEKNSLNENKEENGRTMLNMQREVDKLSDQIREQSQEERIDNQQTQLENYIQEQRNKLNQLEKDLIITEGRIEIEKEKQKNIKIFEKIKISSDQNETSVDLQYVKNKLEEIRKNQKKLIDRIEEAEGTKDFQEIKEFARVIQQQLYDLKAEIEKGKRVMSANNQKENKKSEKEEEDKSSKILLDLQKKNENIRQKIVQVEKEIKEKETKLQRQNALNREKRHKFFELEKIFRTKQYELDKLKDKFNESKIALARIEAREDNLKKQVKEELKRDVEKLDIANKEEKIDQSSLENEIYKLKIKMEQIGGIDPMVIDEYNDTNKRFDFLITESQDLEKAISSLKNVIKKMDQKIEKRFLSAYKEINQEFTEYFKIIFGGGRANLSKLKIKNRKLRIQKNSSKENLEMEQLENIPDGDQLEEDQEEIGIEISACPPGKKISNLNMLSGGERSLTSLALLFAIISYNPPPFAILDEVEAALDEANSKRFGRIIKELSGKTQFIIITHNRETMRQASLLYGVTMSESGISKLLSVRMDQIGAKGQIIKLES